MIRYLRHSEIDKEKWDRCMDQCANSLIYGYSWYLDIVCPEWEALVEGDYQSLMPLTAGKKYGVSYLYPPYFAQQLGVFSKDKPSKEKVSQFLQAIPDPYQFLEIHLNARNTFEFLDFEIKRNINLEVSLDAPYPALYQNFSEDTKRNIKKAEKNNFSLQKNIPAEKIIRLFRENTGKKITNLKNRNYTLLLRLIECCMEKRYAETWGAYKDNALCAGVVWLIKDGRAIFLFSGTNAEAKRTGGMFFLVNRFIQEHAGKPVILDFEGSNLPGLARFYKGFGSRESVYLQVRKNRLPRLVRWIKEIKR